MKRYSIIVCCLLALGLLAGCGGGGSKTVTQSSSTPASTTPSSTTPSTTTPSGGEQMGTVPQSASSSGGQFDATQSSVLRQIEAKLDTIASSKGLRHVVTHCSADSSTQATCTLKAVRPDGSQGNETDVISVDPNTGALNLVSQSS